MSFKFIDSDEDEIKWWRKALLIGGWLGSMLFSNISGELLCRM